MHGSTFPINPILEIKDLPDGLTVDAVLDVATELGKIPTERLQLGDLMGLAVAYGALRGITERARKAQEGTS